jgi:DNA-binding transcriptional LysR family regulator
MDRVKRAEQAAQAEATEPRGSLRISAPAPYAWTHIAPLLPEFMERYPDVGLDLQVTSEIVDLVTSGFDLAIRLCTNNDPNSIVRRVGSTVIIIAAARELIERLGLPKEPEDMAGWPGLVYSPHGEAGQWKLRRGADLRRVSYRPCFVSNSINLTVQVALAGAGAAQIGEYAVSDELKDGRLIRLLPDWQVADVPVLIVFPHNRHISAKAKVFSDFLAKKLKSQGT